MKDVDIIFGKTLKKYRKNKNLTQVELADLSYINIKTISNMENGKVDIDLDKLEILSEVLNVDLIYEYLSIILKDSIIINKIISNLNSKDRIPGSTQRYEIDIISDIENNCKRNITKLKATKLRLFFENIEAKNKKIKLDKIIEALNLGKKFDFSNLSSNSYDYLDYRLTMNYAINQDNLEERLRYLIFLDNANIKDDNLNSIIYHNIAVTYYRLYNSELALTYINKALSTNSKNPISPSMLYMQSLILFDLSDNDYLNSVDLALKNAKENDISLYNTILNKYKKIHKENPCFKLNNRVESK